MTIINLTLEQYATQLRQLGNGRFKKAALRGAKMGAMRAVSTLQRATSLAGPANPQRVGTGGAVNTGAYKRAWKWETLPDGARVFNAMPYASVIEFGRRSGVTAQPPTLAIANWAQRRLGLPALDARRAAFAIAAAIKQRGLLPRLVLTNQRSNIEQGFHAEVQKELAKELATP